MSPWRSTSAWKTFALATAVAVAGGVVVVRTPRDATTREVSEFVEGGGAAGPGAEGSSQRIAGRAGRVINKSGLECAPGRNGGETAPGVTATSVKVGATVVDSGVGASFLRDARYGMLAVANKVNRLGGICGRKLDLAMVDDGWRFDLGGQFLRNLVEDKKVFALAVVPSSEGLKNVSDAGYLRKQKIPVVGSDGMLIHQYTDPYIWPVAASTISTMHIMVKQAYDAGVRHFGMVYEHTYRFGREGAYAFNAAVRRVTRRDIPGYTDPINDPGCSERFCGIQAGQGSYDQELNTFNTACLDESENPKCQFVAVLLEPATALSWMTGSINPTQNNIRMAGPQPLFTRQFAEECGSKCHKVWLWTGYDPPIGGNLGRPAIKAFVNDVKATSSSADFNNTFVEGAYVGMNLLVEAVRDVGPNLTRENLATVLDSMTFDSGLTAPLSWKPGDHFANVRMQAYSIQYKDRFSGWRDERTRLADPWVGKDIPASS